MKLFSDARQDRIERKNCGASLVTSSLMSIITTKTMIDLVNMSVMYGKGIPTYHLRPQLHINVEKVTDYVYIQHS